MKTPSGAAGKVLGFLFQFLFFLILFNVATLFLIARPSSFSPFRYMGF